MIAQIELLYTLQTIDTNIKNAESLQKKYLADAKSLEAADKKEESLHEIARVLKTDSLFSGTTYVKGKRLLTDLIVTLIFATQGAFTRPFFNEHEWLLKFEKYFTIRCADSVKSGLHFELIRNEADDGDS